MEISQNYLRSIRHLVGFTLILVLAVNMAFAGATVNEGLLGLSEQGLKESVPEVSQVLKPNLGPHGGRGMFALKKANLNGQIFEVTFYFKNKRIERIEERRSPQYGKCDAEYSALINSLDQQYGAEVRATGPAGVSDIPASMAWTRENFSVAAYKLGDQTHCELLTTIESRLIKDASAL